MDCFGWMLSFEDPLKVDQLIYAVRRHCRVYGPQGLVPPSGVHGDVIERLAAHPTEWSVRRASPVERLLQAPSSSLRRNLFVRVNLPFAPGAHDLEFWKMTLSTGSSPL